ncbi:YtzI protein [Priestia abyssalis]|uniref:YtzI protein n=1 Tax=Priestia abyssalis TaxID=1221450 RepID=UPI000994AAC5|nr:YtzI protein [Priestia abyssalis]
MYTILIICIVIVIVILLLSVLTTSKAYDYKHSVDSLEDNPHLHSTDKDDRPDKE